MVAPVKRLRLTVDETTAKTYWRRFKPYLYSPSGRPKYIGKNTDIDAAETDTDWSIWKYTDADIPEIEGPRFGAVDTEGGIDGLSWNI